MIENNPSARMQLRSRGQLVAPACCCVCGNATCDEGYLDLGAFVDFHGTLYLCMFCITQGAEICGMFTIKEVGILQKQLEGLLEDNTKLATELISANEYISNFDRVLRAALTPSSDADSNSGEGVSEPTHGSASGEPEPTEPDPFNEPQPTSGTKLSNITFE